ncbi:nuclear transport factor 2 family protein [Dactylosporangium sp. NPDC051541]|uniref:nuclear transport factor 2 family protein n=1 Tax=Dactylosporangium sp. NPDC051541 TaxID=3363977 RepID=UPI0037929BEE
MDGTPRELFDRMANEWLTRPTEVTGDQFADDVVIEMPFAPPGARNRFASKQDFLDFARPQRAAFPARIDECRVIAVHDTADPGTIVVEYELSGVAHKDGARSAAAFVLVLTARAGKITHWREYQDVAAMRRALA